MKDFVFGRSQGKLSCALSRWPLPDNGHLTILVLWRLSNSSDTQLLKNLTLRTLEAKQNFQGKGLEMAHNLNVHI